MPDPWDSPASAVRGERLRRQTKPIKWFVWLAFGLVSVFVVSSGLDGWSYLQKVRPEGATDQQPTVDFIILESDTLASITDRLVEAGLVADATVFLWYVEQKGGLVITPGYYQVPTNEHIGNVLARLRTPPSNTYRRVTFPEGFTLQQMADRLVDVQPRLSADAFLVAANSPVVNDLFRPVGTSSLEGLLFPDTYQISNADNEAQIVERMVGLMERVAGQEDLIERAAVLGRTPYEILIIASMIEKEAKIEPDRAKIARVIYNRLYLNMLLQIDATLYYGEATTTPFSILRNRDTPYNTYLYTGLPPTPIGNPGRASIRAALNPAANPSAGDPLCQALPDPTSGCFYLYYVLATEEGGHAFAATLEQHERNIQLAIEAGIL